jgi:YidC/Oxa1 family membrane protein insertase
MIALYNTLIYQPLYNGLIFLMTALPWADAGVIVILSTIILRLILYPLAKSSVSTQIKMKKYEPELNAIREKYNNDKQEQARQTMQFYKDKDLHPFSSFFFILIQLPIIIAFYRIFLTAGLPSINKDLLYSFVSVPSHVNMTFLGIFNISHKSALLAIIVGISTYLQIKLSMPATKARSEKDTFKDDFARSMSMQMTYVFPIVSALISYSLSGTIALYWLTSNVFTIAQEIFLRKKLAYSNNGEKK